MSPSPSEPLDAAACLHHAKRLMRGRGGTQRDFEQALYYFDLAAQAGDLDAMYWLGKCYWRGIGCALDPSGALSCFENAANRGHVAAARRLAHSFKEGQHVPQNDILAQYWTLRADAMEEGAARSDKK